MYIKGKYYEVWGHRFSQPYHIGRCSYLGQDKLLVQFSEGARTRIVHKFMTDSGTIVYDEDFEIKSEGNSDFDSMLDTIDKEEL